MCIRDSPKGNEHRKALRGEGAESVNLPHAKRQGGVISPILANMALDGMQKVLSDRRCV